MKQIENQKSVNRELSLSFTKYMQKYPKLYVFLAEKIKDNLDKSIKKPIIIELSTGPGFLSLELNKLIPNSLIIGLDPSYNMLDIAKDKLSNCNGCRLICSKVENIPICTSFADVVVSRFGLSSWDNPQKGSLEVNRILRPKGKVVLEILNKDYPNWKLFLMKLHMLIKGADSRVIKYNMDCYKTAYSLSKTEKILKEAGFRVIEKEGKSKDWKFLVTAVKS